MSLQAKGPFVNCVTSDKGWGMGEVNRRNLSSVTQSPTAVKISVTHRNSRKSERDEGGGVNPSRKKPAPRVTEFSGSPSVALAIDLTIIAKFSTKFKFPRQRRYGTHRSARLGVLTCLALRERGALAALACGIGHRRKKEKKKNTYEFEGMRRYVSARRRLTHPQITCVACV